MGRVQELETAKFHERDVTSGQFDFEHSAVRRCAEQDGLMFQQHTLFAICQDLFDPAAGLVGLVANREKLWLLRGPPLCPEVFCEALLGKSNHAVGCR